MKQVKRYYSSGALYSKETLKEDDTWKIKPCMLMINLMGMQKDIGLMVN